ncbi:conserved hypothetical protein [Coccidioides posadasii str. Silveira]|uniref:Uncharacterized protein n=1 Tax=Coccidioides posadasii (strain RMSCC 757 / Silveira) TaxID=443226 RepID=E9D4A2_COCPS|nr:conserved hypothetical protein [Coccidioides posadasii str. Silveira]
MDEQRRCFKGFVTSSRKKGRSATREATMEDRNPTLLTSKCFSMTGLLPLEGLGAAHLGFGRGYEVANTQLAIRCRGPRLRHVGERFLTENVHCGPAPFCNLSSQ